MGASVRDGWLRPRGAWEREVALTGQESRGLRSEKAFGATSRGVGTLPQAEQAGT